MDNSKKIYLFLNENICFDLSLEPSQQDNSNEVSKHINEETCFYEEIWIFFPRLFLLPIHIWSSVT